MKSHSALLALLIMFSAQAFGAAPNTTKLKILQRKPSRTAPEKALAGPLVKADQTFRNFLNCQSHFDPKDYESSSNLFACTEQFMSPKLSERTRRDYDQFLFSPFTIREPNICDEKQTRFLKGFEDTPALFLCFEVVDENEKQIKHGYVFFEELKDRVVITKIKF